ncbi:acyl-CoA dehydrogenase [Paenibacillus sp. H1-7]|uniref:acyl-CoA dehydrogenase family protein n=1 Tax=Paenibacillus sp. H1-7 TaxID=2282849 RepID=UPI001EF7A2CA|nr:acyl-CoA dehydrogenase family protein [Paenibacillus sp. H1-7]ULL15867.1 acyl-CoA dehydrogenase [Paenibacillus sp. H1-7]
MTERRTLDYFIRNEKEAELAALADRLAEGFASRAAAHDADGSFPFENFEEMKKSGFLKLAVPKEYGGDEIGLYELALVQERLARGDGSTALSVGWHMGHMLHYRIARPWPESLFEWFCSEVVTKGAMINSFASERATGSPSRGGKPQTVAEKVDGGWLLTGRKTYSTLSPILEHFIVSAAIADEDRNGEFFVTRSPGITIEETWNTLGMRSTGSHDLVLDRVFVPDHAFVSQAAETERKYPKQNDGGGWMLFIPACYLGIAWAAKDFAVRYAKQYRPNSLPGPISDLPNVQQLIGSMEVELTTARHLLYSVAARWDEQPEARSALKTECGIVKHVATNHAIQVVDKAMRIVGGASLSRALPLERMYRDVRAGLHNPPMDDVVIKNAALRAIAEQELS